jgi:hypothetical protein
VSSTPVTDPTEHDPPVGVSWPLELVAWIGLALHGLLGVLYLLSGLLAPVWAAFFLWTLWTGLLAVAIHQRRRRPIVVALIPIIGLVVWSVTIWAVSLLAGGASN